MDDTELNIPVRKFNYAQKLYSSENYGVHSMGISFGGLTLYYSYDTIIGFCLNHREWFCENIWGRTTGKHLNVLCSKERRIKHEVFIKMLKEVLKDFKWKVILT
jgi:hypothetical protein